MENTKRIHLLSSTEVEDLYAQPAFNAHEQRLYFTLTQSERAALAHVNAAVNPLIFAAEPLPIKRQLI
jgi:hypothetical protein